MRRSIVRLLKGFSSRFPRVYPILWSVHCRAPKVAITFDDGPTEQTPAVLSCLAASNARATFFVLANQVSQRPDTMQQILAEGHEIGIHGDDHSMHNYYGQVQRCVRELSGFGATPRVVRTPGGVIRPLLVLRLRWLGYPTVLWSLDSRDSMRLEGKWNGPPPKYEDIGAGDIVLMHDDNSICVEELPALLQIVNSKGLSCVTVSELMGRNSR